MCLYDQFDYYLPYDWWLYVSNARLTSQSHWNLHVRYGFEQNDIFRLSLTFLFHFHFIFSKIKGKFCFWWNFLRKWSKPVKRVDRNRSIYLSIYLSRSIQVDIYQISRYTFNFGQSEQSEIFIFSKTNWHSVLFDWLNLLFITYTDIATFPLAEIKVSREAIEPSRDNSLFGLSREGISIFFLN